jgi:glyceraldehyde-3-phosphate dehydrogenase (NAD(P))
MADARRVRVAINGYGVIGKRVADALIRGDSGLPALNSVKEWMLDIGRPHGDLYEVALWEDMVTVHGDEAFYAYMVDNQAIVIPETIDALRAITGIEANAAASITATNAALGIGRLTAARQAKG